MANSAKAGRNANRPSQKRYTAAKRWVTNKNKAIKRHERQMAQEAVRKILRKPESQRDYERLRQLRYIISQNATGA